MYLSILVLLPVVASQGISRPVFDCSRLHPSFCCTSRLRELCQQQCASVSCEGNHYQQLFSTDLDASHHFLKARDGDTEAQTGDLAPPPLPPPPPPPPQPVPQAPIPEMPSLAGISVPGIPKPPENFMPTTPVYTTTPKPESFPTLIPFEPNVDSVPQEKDLSWPVPTAAPVIQATRPHTTPDPRIIRPPDRSLVFIGETEESDGGVLLQKSAIEQVDFTGSQGGGSFVRRSIPGSEVLQTKDGNWGTVPRQPPPPPTFQRTVNGAIDGSAGRPAPGTAVARRIVNPNRPSKPQPQPPRRPAPWPKGVSPTEFLPFRNEKRPAPVQPIRPEMNRVSSSALVPQVPPPQPPPPRPPQPPPANCGVAPDFIPCVSSQIASLKLLQCCREKGLPPGCQSLCRYDITQVEVRAALDRGQCSLLSVAPFLECAAQGHDNAQCCAARGVAQKSGPQCLQFCSPSRGLTPLGLQHVVCGNAIGEMLHCHHSGIR